MNALRTFGFLVAMLFATQALAYGIGGFVYCDSNGDGVIDADDAPLANVVVVLEEAGGYSISTSTDGAGQYSQFGLFAGTWTVSIDGSSLNADATVAVPASGVHEVVLTPDSAFPDGVNFLIDDPACRPVELGACWMTAGGVKFEPIVRADLAEKGPKDSFGGNVYPSCSQFPGNGGQWNHIAHSLKLHFMGTDIQVIRCGNVDGIEPGSESPVTPFNFIEFQGTGWVQGIKGNKVDRTPVSFTARVEDRNEPGNEHATAGEDIDRYYLNVPGFFEVADELGDPITITGGNLQLHATSCD